MKAPTTMIITHKYLCHKHKTPHKAGFALCLNRCQIQRLSKFGNSASITVKYLNH